MHLLVLGVGSSFQTFGIQFSSSDLMPGYEASEKKKLWKNEENLRGMKQYLSRNSSERSNMF